MMPLELFLMLTEFRRPLKTTKPRRRRRTTTTAAAAR
jgi:hypothetical protein